MDAQLDVLFAVATACMSSFFVCLMILLSQPLHSRFSMDSDMAGIQKFHKKPVPRIGGVAVLMGLIAVPLCIYFLSDHSALNGYRRPMFYAILAAGPIGPE